MKRHNLPGQMSREMRSCMSSRPSSTRALLKQSAWPTALWVAELRRPLLLPLMVASSPLEAGPQGNDEVPLAPVITACPRSCCDGAGECDRARHGCDQASHADRAATTACGQQTCRAEGARPRDGVLAWPTLT